MNIRLGLSLLAFAGTLALAAPAQANMITNGNFEDSANWDDWTFTRPGAPAGEPAGIYGGDFHGIRDASGAGNGTAANGSYVGGLEWTPGTTSLQQGVSGFIVGGAYRLEWDLNLRDFDGGTNNSFAVFLDAIDASVPGPHTLFTGGSPLDWDDGYHHVTIDFVATSTSHTIIFGGQGFPSDVSYNIDNVNLLQAVPEPASLALMGLGLAGLGWSRRKR